MNSIGTPQWQWWFFEYMENTCICTVCTCIYFVFNENEMKILSSKSSPSMANIVQPKIPQIDNGLKLFIFINF